MAEVFTSCVNDCEYEVLPVGKGTYRGLSYKSARQLTSGNKVYVLILPDEATYIREQIISELQAVLGLMRDDVLLPMDVLVLSAKSLALVYPATGQVSIADVLDRGQEALSETVALAVMNKLLSAVVHLQNASCPLGGLDSSGVLLLGHKQIQIGPILLPCCQAFVQNSSWLLLAPDVGISDMDHSHEVYSVAVLLLCCLNKALWNSGVHASGTQQYVRDEGMQDYFDGLLEISEPTRELLQTALSDDPEKRYDDAASF
ncbi:MAG: hypothetical protein HRU15_11110, partial [Planctomycetes bacterium]|nr:hypothetical protein [Planctomycetota bacterium]